jgi:asparagine synthase (glutamine-hydrolysing)
MCGIAGYFGTRQLDDKTIAATLALMRRRGPDAAAHRHFRSPGGRNLHLLHTRLTIVDLDPRSNQPLTLGPVTIAFNGEVYNFVELRQEMQKRGHSFGTTSDTEVLARVLADDGASALDRCEGMWAFAAHDERDGSLLLSRDRFGEKPLYLHRAPDGLYFASEAKFLFAMLGRRLPIDLDHLRRYVVHGYKALYKGEGAFFHGLGELAPATWLRVDADGRESSGRYWNPSYEQDDAMPYEDAVRGVRERLVRSVELRLRADVPIAFCMSGGVDSNSLIAIAKKELGYNLHGFTIANSDERYEESDLVDLTVRELNLKHTSIPTDTHDFLPKLRTLVRQHDAPVYTITYYAHWLLMENIAAHGYRISVSGTAADELFTGYYDHHLAYLAMVRGEPERYSGYLRSWTEHVEPMVRNPFLSNPDLFVRDPAFRDHIYLDAASFAEYLTTPWSEPFAETAYTKDLLRNRMFNELFHEATPVILHEDDLNAMYFSIENRSPFLDRTLFEHAVRIPTRHLMRDGFGKVVLRDAMRGTVPDPVLDSRRKVGFNAPIFSFLDVHDPGVREQLLERSPVWDLLRRDKIEVLLDKAHLPNSQSKFLFYFLCTKLFLEQYAG